MNPSDRIYVAGHRGLAGSAIVRELQAHGHTKLLLKTHAELNLEDPLATAAFFETERPDYVFLAAARVGGIVANNDLPVDFLMTNLAIQANVINAAFKTQVKRLLFLGSSCIYPRDCPQPIKEEYLLTGPLEPTNRPYAIAKIAGIEMCWSYNRQYGTKYLAAMPTNLYGPGDNYHPQHSHVLPALIRKMHEAKTSNAPTANIWGSGTPRREFLQSDDLGRALVFLMNLPEAQFDSLVSKETCPLINVGTEIDLTIRELAETVAKAVGYEGGFIYDASKPDGTPRKLMDSSRLAALGWKPDIAFFEGIVRAYQDFKDQNRAAARESLTQS